MHRASIVLDCSYFAASFFPESLSPIRPLIPRLESGEIVALVPFVFHLEVQQVILKKFRRKMLAQSEVYTFFDLVGRLPLEADKPSYDTSQWRQILECGIKHGLDSYDASYLELSMRKKFPLATLDKRLAQAAKSEGLLFEI